MPATKHIALFLAAAFWGNAAAPVVNPSETEAEYQRLVAHCRNVTCAELAPLLNNLGSLYFLMGRYSDAEPALREAVKLEVQEDQTLAISLSNLAAVYRAESRFLEADSVSAQAVCILEEHAPQGAELPRVLIRAAMIALDLRNLERAEALSRRALALVQPDSTDAAAAHNTLGSILDAQARLSDAVEELRAALELRERHMGANHPLVAETLDKLGLVYRQQGRMDEAENQYRRALAILRAHPVGSELGSALNNLGNLLAATGHLQQGERLLREAISVWQRVLGPEHPNVAAALSNLSSLARARKQYGEAESLLRQAVAMDVRLFPADHVRIGLDLNNAGALASERKRYAEAEALLQQSVTILSKALPAGHPDTGRAVVNLAEVLRKERRVEESDLRYREGLDILTKAWGSDDPRLLTWLEPYARLLRAEENYADAARVDMQAMRIRVRAAIK